MPIVQLNRHSVPLQTDAVVSDDEFGIEAITDLALQAGHTDLALVIGGADHSTTADRMRGFRNAVDRAGIPEAPKGTAGRRFRILEGDFTSAWGRNAMHAIAGDLPDVVIAASSRIALGVLHACSDLGLSVPSHLSVAAHGNPEWYEVFPPGITSYAPPLAEMGQEAAVRILAKMKAGAEDGVPITTRLRGEVHHRHSIGGSSPRPLRDDFRSPARLRQHRIQRRVALVHAALHAGLQHAVALLGGVELTDDRQLGAPVTEVGVGVVLDDDVARHAVPLERVHQALLRGDLPESASKPWVSPSECSTKRQCPPRSNSQRSTSSSFPRPHHWARSSGLVNAAHTRSRGALKMRSTWISRSVGVETVAVVEVCEVLMTCLPFD